MHTPAATPAQTLRPTDADERPPGRGVIGSIRDRLTEADAASGFVLDGFPCGDLVPAQALDAMLADRGTPVDQLVDLALSDAEVLRRRCGAPSCRACWRACPVALVPSTHPDICDCGGELFQLYEDTPRLVAMRLQSYRAAVASTLDHYKVRNKLASIDATLPPAQI